MEIQLTKQRKYILESGIVFDSSFESGNLASVTEKENFTFYLSLQPDPHSSYKTWFYFAIEGIPIGVTANFVVVNMSNQVKLFRQGHVPVFKSDDYPLWSRIRLPIQQNGVAKGEQGFELTFRHIFTTKCRHYFAFSYPWTYSECNSLIRKYTDTHHERVFCDYRQLCRSSKKLAVNLLTVTKLSQKSSLDVRQFAEIQNFTAYTFPNKKGIFISSRVHPGEVASSFILNGFLSFLFSKSPEAQKLLQKCVFYIIPMLNPDGVVDGNFRCDSRGYNLNRFYTDPSKDQQPEIYGVKSFVVGMIRADLIHFCLDLHAHVNKQGAFMYGNSTTSLKDQVQVLLFPKLLQYNCRFFDFQSSNFSEKNMSSKDRADDLSKQGASRVTFFKETGLLNCWTLQCNYNSSRVINQLPKEVEEGVSTKSASHGVILSVAQPKKREQVGLLNIQQFQEIGRNIGITLLDFYRLRTTNRFSNTLLKNWNNLHLNLAVRALRLIPFRFDNDCRKILNNLNSGNRVGDSLNLILQKLALDPLSQILVPKQQRQKSVVKKQKTINLFEQKTLSHKLVRKSISVNIKERKSSQVEKKIEMKPKILILAPNIPKQAKKQ